MMISHEIQNEKHEKLAPYWATGMVVLGGIALASGWIDLGRFWKGYVLDIAGPAWIYILIRGLYRKKVDSRWIGIFSPARTLIIFIFVLVCIEMTH
jgi:hypothetical protein